MGSRRNHRVRIDSRGAVVNVTAHPHPAISRQMWKIENTRTPKVGGEVEQEMHTCACLFIKSVEDEENATESYTPFQHSLGSVSKVPPE